ncbi:GTP-binding protein [Candidatus Thorarchaeota archaeon]|nr:MAG: GTP-binding protein [Candidatus Thorarchaeota archaeon]
MSPTYLLKVVTVGAASVGKTSIIIRYSTGTFREHYSPTLGTGFAYKKIRVDGNLVNLQIWDLGSQEFLERVRANYYMGTQGVIIMYDVTNWESFYAVRAWKGEVDKNVEEYRSLLVANKTDLTIDRVVPTEEGENLAKELGMDYIETSVRQDKNVNRAFETIARSICEWLF